MESFNDVRAIQQQLQAAGVELAETTDATTKSPAHITLTDPDGNSIPIDQYVG